MPNWVLNRIAVKGNKSSLIAWVNKGLANDKRKSIADDMSCEDIARVLNKECLSLESFIPMPQTYRDYDTASDVPNSFKWLSVRLYQGKMPKAIQSVFNAWLYDKLGYDNTNMKGVGIKKLIKLCRKNNEVFTNLVKIFKDTYCSSDLLDQMVEEYNKYVEEWKAAAEYQQKTYGVVGWDKWRRENLGCGSNAEFYNVELKNLGDDLWVMYFSCDTAWYIPSDWLRTMQASNKANLTFFCRSEEEQGNWNGYFCCTEKTWREDHEYDGGIEEDLTIEQWRVLSEEIDKRFVADVECQFETIETE